ncbi:MAG: pyruvate ferredoxin oxidoreductase [Methanomassiliicoccales archaeon]|nr:MAG: pyruvate ferredoxin oxidoreductase [Methanomassiliicoccales archaeon]
MPKVVITGNYSLAYGAKLCRAEVVAAYPITPQTTVVEKIAEFVANDEMDTQYVKVESEHTAMAACISASLTGARTFTATSAHGLTLMHEVLIWASGSRTPIIMGNINRAMAPPWSVWADHLDSVAQRDTGWMQIYAETNQEVLDSIIQAYKLCENNDVLLPCMIMEDAFFLSHTSEAVDLPEQSEVDAFLPPFDPPEKLDVDDPKGFCSLVMPDWYMEFRYLMHEAWNRARKIIYDVVEDFEKKFGRNHGALLDIYRCDDADAVLMAAGTAAATCREVVDDLRSKGKKVGLARIRFFRPFPTDELRSLAKEVDSIGVLDRSFTFGHGGAFYSEVAGALYNSPTKPALKNYIAGLGGRDITPVTLERLFEDVLNLPENGTEQEIEWVDLKDTPPKEVS